MAVGLIIGYAIGAVTAWLAMWLHVGRLALDRKTVLELIRSQAALAGREAALESLPERATHQIKVPFDERPTLVADPKRPGEWPAQK